MQQFKRLIAAATAAILSVFSAPAQAHPVEQCMADMIEYCELWEQGFGVTDCITQAIGTCATHNPHPPGPGGNPGGPEDEAAASGGVLDQQFQRLEQQLRTLRIQRAILDQHRIIAAARSPKPKAFFDCMKRSQSSGDTRGCLADFAPAKVPFQTPSTFAAVPDGQAIECDNFGLCWAVCSEGDCGALALGCPSVQTHQEGACDSFCDGDDVCYCQCDVE